MTRAGRVALFIALVWPVAAMATPRTVALVVGNNASPLKDPDLAPLRFADDDALRFAELFSRTTEHVEFLSVLDDRTQTRHPEAAARAKPPTLAALDAAVSRLASVLDRWRGEGSATQAYVTFSGHGSSRGDGEPYLAFLDGELTGDDLFERVVAKLAADRVHLIIDACNAGAVVGMKGRFDREAEAQRVELSEEALRQLAKTRALARYPNVGVIVAASAGQEAHEWSRIESGVFSHEVFSALVGPADVNGDLLIEYSELQAFVASANSAIEDPRAKPTIMTHAPTADRRTPLMALRSLEQTALLRGTPNALGHFHIEQSNGRRNLDAHLVSAGSVTIAIPAGASLFLRTATEETSISAKPGTVIDFGDLELKRRVTASRGATDEAYRKALFAVAYGPTYYQGYVDSQELVGVDLGNVRFASMPTGVRRDRILAFSSLGVAGAAALTAIVAGAIALKAKRDFGATDIQRDATRFADRHRTFRTLSWISLGIAGAAGAAGWYFWPVLENGHNLTVRNHESIYRIGFGGRF